MFSNTRNRTDSNSSDASSSSSAGSGGQASLIRQIHSNRDICFKSGKLIKQGKTVKNWKERYFMLRKDGLYYHEVNYKGQAGKLKGCISFKEIKGNTTCIQKVAVTIKNKQKTAISIELPGRVYYVYSDSDMDLNDWYKSIHNVLTMKDEEPKLTPRTGGTPTTPTSASGGISQDIFSKGGSGSVGIGSGGVGGGNLGSYSSSPGLGSSVSSGTFGTPPVGGLLSGTKSFELKKGSPSSVSSPLVNGGGSFNEYGMSPLDFKRTNSNLSDVSLSDDSDSSSYPKSGFLNGDLISEFDEWTGTRHSDSDSVDFDAQPQPATVGPLLTEDDEYNIAMSSVEIFLKKEEDRTPHEQAYVIALNDYRRKLDEHARRSNARPEYSLAVGTCIFLIPEKERTLSEQEYVKDILSAFYEDQKDSDKYRLLPIKIQMDIVKAARSIKDKPEQQRTEEEKQYITRVDEIQRQINRFALKHGLKVNHSLGTLPLQLLTSEKDQQPAQHPLYHNSVLREADPQGGEVDEKPDFLTLEQFEFSKVFVDSSSLNF